MFPVLVVGTPLHAYERLGPFPVRTQNPLYLLFLGMRPERPVTLQQGKFDLQFNSSYSSIFQKVSRGGSAVDFDMELWRFGPVAKYGITDDLEVGLEMPILHFGGGFLDSFIQSYHNTFGFPNAGRETVPNSRFSYKVNSGGATLYQVGSRPLGLSDLIFDVKYRFLKENVSADLALPVRAKGLSGGRSAAKGGSESFPMTPIGWMPTLAAQAMFKAPTGIRSQGLGSGRPDGGLFLLAEDGWRWLAAYGDVGVLMLGGTAPLETIEHQLSWAWMTGLEFSVTDSVAALAQANGNTAVFHGTGLTELDKAPLDLTLGVKGRAQQWIWQVGFTEDPKADDPSVDFTIFMSVGWNPAFGGIRDRNARRLANGL